VLPAHRHAVEVLRVGSVVSDQAREVVPPYCVHKIQIYGNLLFYLHPVARIINLCNYHSLYYLLDSFNLTETFSLCNSKDVYVRIGRGNNTKPMKKQQQQQQ